MAGGAAEEVEAWQLTRGPQAFHYLNTSGCVAVPEHDDKKEFVALRADFVWSAEVVPATHKHTYARTLCVEI